MKGQESQPTPLIDLSWLVCQYTTRGLVASGKRKTPSETGVEWRGRDTLGEVIAAEVMRGYGPPAHSWAHQRHGSSTFSTHRKREHVDSVLTPRPGRTGTRERR